MSLPLSYFQEPTFEWALHAVWHELELSGSDWHLPCFSVSDCHRLWISVPAIHFVFSVYHENDFLPLSFVHSFVRFFVRTYAHTIYATRHTFLDHHKHMNVFTIVTKSRSVWDTLFSLSFVYFSPFLPLSLSLRFSQGQQLSSWNLKNCISQEQCHIA